MPRRSGFLDPIETRQFPGSSGYWATSPSSASPNSSLNGFTYPGDAARARFEQGGTPSVIASRYGGGTTTGSGGGSSGFTPLVVEKFPGSGYNDALTRLNESLGKAPQLPSFSETITNIRNANDQLPGAFDRYQGAMDNTGYENFMRSQYPQYDALTGGYSDTARGIGSRYGQSVEDYRQQGQGVVDENMANAIRFRDEVIPANVQSALDTVGKNLKLYDFANPGGYNSAIPAIGGREAVKATLPFQLEANREVGAATRFGLPFYGDVASRYANLAGFNLSNERDIYGNQQADLARKAQTEDKIKNLQIQTAGLSLEAAIRKAPSLAAGAYELSRVFNLPVEDIVRRAQAMGVLLNLQGQANYTGVEMNGGQYVQDPFGPNTPGIPSRYQPATTTGNDLGRGTNSGQSAPYTLEQSYAINPATPQNMGNGIWDLPNRYTWGRNPQEQAQFETVQRGYQ